MSAPAPVFVRLKLVPEMMPPTVRLPPLTVTVRLAPSATVPVPMFRSLVPVKAKSPFQLCVLLLVRVRLVPLVLSSVPPVMVMLPLPGAVALFRFSVPALSVSPPPKVLAPESVSVPAPDLLKPALEPARFAEITFVPLLAVSRNAEALAVLAVSVLAPPIVMPPVFRVTVLTA